MISSWHFDVGKQYSLFNSRIMIHQPIVSFQVADSDVMTKEMLHDKVSLNFYLAHNTGQSLEKINEDIERDFFMNTKEAMERGLLDAVIGSPRSTSITTVF
ncbi:putative endopeptidase Clp [Dioscorea sansibarensis]